MGSVDMGKTENRAETAVIGLASEEDVNDIVQLIEKRCLWFREKGLPGWSIEDYPVRYNREYFRESMQSGKLITAKIEGVLAGTMLLRTTDPEYWQDACSAYYIHHLATDPEIHGLGRKMVGYARKLCEEEGKDYLRLDYDVRSPFLGKYYDSLGFNDAGGGKTRHFEYRLMQLPTGRNGA